MAPSSSGGCRNALTERVRGGRNMSSVPYEEKATTALKHLGMSTALAQLDTAAQQAAAEKWSYTHFLGYLLSGEIAERHRKTVALNLQVARFPALKRLT